ncbi:tRNA (adenosine(37)-N6)-dimethylallyltransferase MiaA [Patescibacteria group bacterium]|nr:MAG: tRNA (adenosine(37)-N6)-dimethylallyltransferase MiaA [Patescibacteria group bacterium]
MESRRKVIVILGPTASGKSSLAIKLARKFNGEIISADSRQIYRGMNIGTGKVTRAEQRLARHWMLDIVSPKTEYSVAKFKKAANLVIEDILKRDKLPIICGGTGFWIKAIVDNIQFPEVKPDWKLRKELEKESTKKLFQKLQKLDPKRANTIDPQNKVRLVRALEICHSLGSVPPLRATQTNTSNCNFLQIGIALPKKKLDVRIAKRLEQRFKQGMLREVRNLHFKKGTSWKRLEQFGLEYYWIARYLQRKITLVEMKEKLRLDIIHYAKRQMTWFRKDRRIKWLTSYSGIHKKVTEALQE